MSMFNFTSTEENHVWDGCVKDAAACEAAAASQSGSYRLLTLRIPQPPGHVQGCLPILIYCGHRSSES